jgi:hypothetical protein
MPKLVQLNAQQSVEATVESTLTAPVKNAINNDNTISNSDNATSNNEINI